MGVFKMDIKTINYLINYCSNDESKILNELDKEVVFEDILNWILN